VRRVQRQHPPEGRGLPARAGARADFGLAAGIADELVERYTAEEVDEVYVLYGEFRSAIIQRPTVERLLPVGDLPAPGEEAGVDYKFEPSASALLAHLLPRYVQAQVHHALLESAASEQGARMTAMDAATSNASEMIDRLTLVYNRARQAAITTELVEIVSGAEALK
jgi:F-type H+-transporting ATPase subunit gamma